MEHNTDNAVFQSSGAVFLPAELDTKQGMEDWLFL
jgi:hypothetical protein